MRGLCGLHVAGIARHRLFPVEVCTQLFVAPSDMHRLHRLHVAGKWGLQSFPSELPAVCCSQRHALLVCNICMRMFHCMWQEAEACIMHVFRIEGAPSSQQ